MCSHIFNKLWLNIWLSQVVTMLCLWSGKNSILSLCWNEAYQDIPVWIGSKGSWTEEHIYCLTIHRRVDQDTEPCRACIQPCHDNRHLRTFLIIMIMVTHSPVPTRTPPTILWLSVDMYRLWTETKTERGEIHVKQLPARLGPVQTQQSYAELFSPWKIW